MKKNEEYELKKYPEILVNVYRDFRPICPSCQNKHMNYSKSDERKWICSKCHQVFNRVKQLSNVQHLIWSFRMFLKLNNYKANGNLNSFSRSDGDISITRESKNYL
ncbi:MAG: hypothetical protein WED10_09205 [Brumimicrobium sp.]